MQQEDGEVHRNTKLQDRCQCFRNVADLAEENVRAEVIDDWEQHAEHEDKRHNRFFQAEEQNQQRSAHSAKDIQGHFFIDEALGIFQNSRHTTDEAIFIQDVLDLLLRVHRSGICARGIELNDEHRCAGIVIEELLNIARKHFLRRRHIDKIARPHDLLYAFDPFKIAFQF